MAYQDIKARLEAEKAAEAVRRRWTAFWIVVAAIGLGIALSYGWGPAQRLVCEPSPTQGGLTSFGSCVNISKQSR